MCLCDEEDFSEDEGWVWETGGEMGDGAREKRGDERSEKIVCLIIRFRRLVSLFGGGGGGGGSWMYLVRGCRLASLRRAVLYLIIWFT